MGAYLSSGLEEMDEVSLSLNHGSASLWNFFWGGCSAIFFGLLVGLFMLFQA
jgi:hypothetical protein